MHSIVSGPRLTTPWIEICISSLLSSDWVLSRVFVNSKVYTFWYIVITALRVHYVIIATSTIRAYYEFTDLNSYTKLHMAHSATSWLHLWLPNSCINHKSYTIISINDLLHTKTAMYLIQTNPQITPDNQPPITPKWPLLVQTIWQQNWTCWKFVQYTCCVCWQDKVWIFQPAEIVTNLLKVLLVAILAWLKSSGWNDLSFTHENWQCACVSA